MNSWQITKKDVKLLVRDRRTLFVLVALPMAFISILGFSTGQLFSQGQKNRTVRVVFVDESGTELSGKVTGELLKIKALSVEELPNRAAGKAVLAEDKADVLLIIGAGYEERVKELELFEIIDAEKGRLKRKLEGLDISVESGSFLANASELVRELVFAFALRTMAPDVLKKDPKIAKDILLKAKKQARENETKLQEAVDNQPETQSSEKPRTFTNIVYQTLVPSYTVMFVFFIVNFMSRSFIGEREMGTLNRLKMAPVTRTGLMLGKTIPFFLISLVQTTLLFVAGKLLFSMSWGPEPWLLIPVMLCTSMSATALGLLVATTVRTDSQVSAYGNFLVLTMAGISGCMMPRAWQPELMQQVGLITPHAWALIAYDQILSRPEPALSVIWKCCITLLAFASAFFAVGWWRFRDLE